MGSMRRSDLWEAREPNVPDRTKVFVGVAAAGLQLQQRPWLLLLLVLVQCCKLRSSNGEWDDMKDVLGEWKPATRADQQQGWMNVL